jgi:two-component system NtrC family sensor kinase
MIPAPKSRRVLIIDDMPSIHRDFEKALASHADPLADLEKDLFGAAPADPANEIAFELSFASQGLEGVAQAAEALEEGRPYALAFVDVRMPPGLDGIETIVRLWETDPRLEIVICTAYSDYTWQQMLKRLSRTDRFLVLSKPFDSTSVKQLALGLTDKWGLARAAERTSSQLESLVLERTQQLSDANARLQREIKERTELEQRLRHAQKLEALGRLVAGVAHEINNPLAFVISNIEHLKQELTELSEDIGERVEELVGVAEETRVGGKRIQQIVQDLKAFSRPEHRLMEDVDLREVVEFAVRMAQPAFPRGIRVTTQYDELPPIHGSAGQLSQIFLNLMVNAAQAMSSVPEDRRELGVTIRNQGEGRMCVKVTDSGVGIRPEDLPKVFDPFFTTRGIGGGTGLGLSVCHGIVKEMGGKITLESQEGVGTTATVTLPVRRGEHSAQSQLEGSTPARPGHKAPAMSEVAGQ